MGSCQTDCKHFAYVYTEIPKMFEYNLEQFKKPHCEIKKMINHTCNEHCPWYEPTEKTETSQENKAIY